LALAFIGGGNIVGTFLAGWLGGKYPAQKGRLLAAIYFLRAVLFLLMAVLPDHEVIIIVFAGLLGILYLSTVPLTAGLVQDMVGLKYNSTMFGFAFASHQLGSFFGSWLGGKMFDDTGHYYTMWLLCAAVGVVAGLLNLPIKAEPLACHSEACAEAAMKWMESTAVDGDEGAAIKQP
jgi:predicted MFS family arabinose efflux permease